MTKLGGVEVTEMMYLVQKPVTHVLEIAKAMHEERLRGATVRTASK